MIDPVIDLVPRSISRRTRPGRHGRVIERETSLQTRAHLMPLRIPRPRFRLWWLMALVALVALTLYGLMPPRPGAVDLKEGTGPSVVPGDTVDVHYVGRLGGSRLANFLGLGKEFGSSRGRNVPFTFPVRAGQVIKGWDRGVVGMKAGGVRKLVIPPAEAYGELGVPPLVPPNSTLIFEVEVLQVAPKPVQQATP